MGAPITARVSQMQNARLHHGMGTNDSLVFLSVPVWSKMKKSCFIIIACLVGAALLLHGFVICITTFGRKAQSVKCFFIRAGTGANSSHVGLGAGASNTMEIPEKTVGLVIGKGGENIKRIEAQTHARVQVANGVLIISWLG